MRIVLAGVLALAGASGCAVTGFAQSSLGGADNATAIPSPPPLVASPPSAPSAPEAAAPEAAAPQPPGLVQTPPPATSMPMTNNWLPGKTAEIGILDRVDGGIANLQIPVGGQAASGDLQISVLACVMRPADEVADTAIFVNVQSTANNAGPPIFHGWMVRSIPAATVVGDSSETLRVANCT